MGVPHADRDGSERWELEEGDTGDALLPGEDPIRRELEAARGLPEYLDDMKWQLAYWEWLAKFGRRKRIWRSGWDRWGFKWYAGGDEFGRHTVVVGPWVIALWSCRCDDCKADERALLDIIDREV